MLCEPAVEYKVPYWVISSMEVPPQVQAPQTMLAGVLHRVSGVSGRRELPDSQLSPPEKQRALC